MSYGVKQLDIATLLSRLSAVRAGYLDNINQIGLLQVTGARAGYLDELAAANLPTDVAAVKAQTDLLPTDPADQSEVEAEIQKAITSLDFWSNLDDVIDLPAAAADTDLPDVVVAGLPSGISLVRVVPILKVRAIENTNAGGTNAIDGAQAIRVKKSTGTWGVDDLAGIDLPDNLWLVAASTREAGDVLIGDNDVKAEVDGNATYNLRFENAAVDYDYLRLNDVLVGLRFFFTTG